ncbi:hypothetical protein ACIPJN_36935 [Streptomyces sp. NPDC086796]|uniref:hypothetical protein n=1 Tax=Streptomyces sp. NPDC086796 TaxID=3365760 RepID=UPI0038307DEF
MPISPWQSFNPDGGDFYLSFERRFRFVVEDPEHTWRRVWIPTVVACPVCEMDTGLRLAYKVGTDVVLEAACPVGHIWVEPRVDVSQWMAYCRFREGRQDIDWLWLIEAGFGEEPPPPMEMKDIIDAAKVGGKLLAREWKKQARATVRKPVRQAKREMKKQAMRPVAAVLRTAWAWQAGGVQPVEQPRRRRGRTVSEPKTPSVAAYRKAYGVQAPEKGPKCLVCEDSGHITAPGISVPCTECNGPAAALAAAERRPRAREGKDERRPATSTTK